MDIKKFGIVVLILGVLVCSYGSFQIITNQPKKFNRAESKQGVFGGRDDFANKLNVDRINSVRSKNRGDAVTILIAGGVVIFVGLGISFSAKKKD